VNVATSDCAYVASITVTRTDIYPAGQKVNRYWVRSPGSRSIKIEVDSGNAVSWLNPPTELVGDASTRYATFETSSFNVDCSQVTCSSNSCRNPCEQFEIEVTRPTEVTGDTYSLKVTSGVNAGCDDGVSELKVELE
jgi:hypothetical protein